MKENNEVCCGFLCTRTYEGQKDFDQTYKEVTIKKRIRKIGPSDTDYVEEEFEEVSETPIKEVIESQADGVGIDAYLRPYLESGQRLPEVKVGDEVQDFTRFPEDADGIIEVGHSLVSAFESLDPVLRGDAKTPEEFLAGLTDAKLKAYYESKINVQKENEDKKDE